MRRTTLWIVSIILLGILIIIFLSQYLDLEPRINLQDLDMSQTSIPTRWLCNWCESERIAEWSYVDEDNPELYWDRSTRVPLTDLKVIHWIDNNHGYVIQLTIIDYKYPYSASWNFDMNDPVGVYQNTFWNFTYAPENIVPPDWSWENKNADEDLVRCGDGTQERCTGWFYQARYGQYYLLVYFYQDLSYETFQEIVIAINESFLQAIH